ncbi:MAG: ABC transporter substrate-binding protein [Ilumatobacteraceae bacterium]
MKIVSLLPSATEIVHALGRGHELAGVTFECDFPLSARADAQIVVGGLDTLHLDPLEIDRLVRAKIAAGEQLYELDAERLRSIAPDTILTQDLCRVCAVPAGQVDDALAAIGCHAAVVTLDPHTLDDVLATIGAIGAATDAEAAATELVVELRERLRLVGSAVDGVTRPRVFVLEWSNPPFVSGHWVPELVGAAGGEPVLCEPGARSHPTDWAAIADARPDVVVVAPCGFDAAGAARQGADVLERLPPAAQVWAVDANAYIVRPGPRLVDGVELLAGLLHPDRWPAPQTDRAIRLR